MEKGVQLLDVCKSIRGKIILSHVNLELESQHIYGLYGRNGSGKTMLILTIAGLIQPTSGEVYVFGERMGVDSSFPQSLGVTVENVGFWPQYTGKECLKLLASIKKIIQDEEIDTALERVGLDPKDKRRYYQYSLGMKQKLAIAQAIMEKPNLILLDEPTNSLDEESIKAVRVLLQEECDRGALVVIASHNKDDIRQLADATFIVEEGSIKHEKVFS